MFERQRSIRALTERLADTDASHPMVTRLCTAATTMLHLDGGSITMGGRNSIRAVLCATNESAAQLEELQDTLGEGPSFDAHDTDTVVQSSGTDLGGRWPMLAEATQVKLGSQPHLLSIPIRPDTGTLGVLTLHASREPHPATDLEEAQFLADAIGYAVLRDWEDIANSIGTWASRDKVNQATGMVVAQLGVAPRDAVAVLRAHAFAIGATLEAVAGAVVGRKLDFNMNGTTSGHGTENDSE